MNARAALAVLLVSACAHAPAAPPLPPRPAEVIAAALPSVVLLVAKKLDGTTGFGAGVIVSHDGRVLTNLHVVQGAASVTALRYSPDFVSYTPMDGGLERFLFERQHFLVKAALVRADDEADLALMQIDSDTSAVPLLTFASTLPQRGERVYALGHPRETVWSFSAGMVSALHQGAIQHDAAINPGSSGGPLLNERGELVGINTSRLFGDSNGVAFARPTDVAQALLSDSGPVYPIDLSTVERAVTSCFRAEETGSANVIDCIDWDSRWAVVLSAAEILDSVLGTHKASRHLISRGGKAAWVAQMKQEWLATKAARRPRPLQTHGEGQASPSVHQQRQALLAQRRERIQRENGLKPDILDVRAVRQVLHRGIRIERTQVVNDSLVWVLVVGRNLDGTEYRLSEAWERSPRGWHQHLPPSLADVKALPAGFARPLIAPDEELALQQLVLLEQLQAPLAPNRDDPSVLPERRLSGSMAPIRAVLPE